MIYSSNAVKNCKSPTKYLIAKYSFWTVQNVEEGEEVPQLDPKVGTNKQYPNFAKSVGVRFTQETGRYTVAEMNIKAGETIAVEEPIVKCVMGEKRGVYCLQCLKRWVEDVNVPTKRNNFNRI
jgi:hypothetical protein